MSANLTLRQGCSHGEKDTSARGGQGTGHRLVSDAQAPGSLPCSLRIMSIDVKYQIWKFGVIFTDNVRGAVGGEGMQQKDVWMRGQPVQSS